MNVYGKAMSHTKRNANSKVVEMVLRKPESQAEAEPKRQNEAIGSLQDALLRPQPIEKIWLRG